MSTYFDSNIKLYKSPSLGNDFPFLFGLIWSGFAEVLSLGRHDPIPVGMHRPCSSSVELVGCGSSRGWRGIPSPISTEIYSLVIIQYTNSVDVVVCCQGPRACSVLVWVRGGFLFFPGKRLILDLCVDVCRVAWWDCPKVVCNNRTHPSHRKDFVRCLVVVKISTIDGQQFRGRENMRMRVWVTWWTPLPPPYIFCSSRKAGIEGSHGFTFCGGRTGNNWHFQSHQK